MIRKMIARYSGFGMIPKIVIATAAGLLMLGIGIRGVQAFKVFLFGNTEAKEARANTVIAEEEGIAARETGIEAANTVTRTFERHTEVERIVRETNDAIARADRGQPMDPELDAAGADGLCRMHDDLCRRQ